MLDSKITMALPESVRITKVTIQWKISDLAKREMEITEEDNIITREVTMAGKPEVQAVVKIKMVILNRRHDGVIWNPSSCLYPQRTSSTTRLLSNETKRTFFMI
jgi:hypothetical protein